MILIPAMSFNISKNVLNSLVFSSIFAQAQTISSFAEGLAVISIQFFSINLVERVVTEPGVACNVFITLPDVSKTALYSGVFLPDHSEFNKIIRLS